MDYILSIILQIRSRNNTAHFSYSFIRLYRSNNVTGNDKNTNIQDQNKEETGTVVYDTPDFSKSAGFKVVLDDSLKDVKYDSIFLTNNSVAQLDLEFPDQTIGTLLVDSNESTYLYDPSDAVFIDDIKVSIEVGILL